MGSDLESEKKPVNSWWPLRCSKVGTRNLVTIFCYNIEQNFFTYYLLIILTLNGSFHHAIDGSIGFYFDRFSRVRNWLTQIILVVIFHVKMYCSSPDSHFIIFCLSTLFCILSINNNINNTNNNCSINIFLFYNFMYVCYILYCKV